MAARPAILQRRLLAWFDASRRELPWRATRDPWRIWVSEIMLQQTRVATALPFYERFVERFPTVSDLARAGEPEVLRAWSGLGYYRRARHLLAAARIVARDHGGRVPRGEAEFGALPGVGRYTRGAVLSIAFGVPLPVLDGNVARVLSRVAAMPHGIRDPRGAQELWQLAAQLVPGARPGDWNQALMELGAMVCTPQQPRCGECPLRAHCAARLANRVDHYPPRAARPATRRVRTAMALVERRGRWLMVRRDGSVMTGMWEPPAAEVPAGAAEVAGESAEPVEASGRPPGARRSRVSRPVAAPASLAHTLDELGIHGAATPTGVRLLHTIMNRAIEVDVWRVAPAHPRRRTRAVTRWVDPRDPDVPLTGIALKLVRAMLAREDAGAAAPRRVT